MILVDAVVVGRDVYAVDPDRVTLPSVLSRAEVTVIHGLFFGRLDYDGGEEVWVALVFDGCNFNYLHCNFLKVVKGRGADLFVSF